MNPLNIPNFNEDEDESEDYPSHSESLRDELLQLLSFRVANIGNYYDNESTLLKHINQGSSESF